MEYVVTLKWIHAYGSRKETDEAESSSSNGSPHTLTWNWKERSVNKIQINKTKHVDTMKELDVYKIGLQKKL
jgi:hypothetical protein